MGAKNLLGIVNRRSSRIKLSALALELFWFGMEFKIALLVEWVPSEENTLADELSKMLILHDFAVSRMHFRRLELRFGTHTIDLFASGANTIYERFYSHHWCKWSGISVNAFACDRGGEIA